MEGNTTLGWGNFDYKFKVLYQLGILNCDGKQGFATIFGVKWGLKSGEVAYPLGRRNVAGMTFLTKTLI